MKKSKLLFLFLLITFILSSICYASDLDAPVEKKMSISSEIKRGDSAILNASKESSYDVLQFSDKIYKVIDYNQQNNTDTDAFRLGAYFTAWLFMDRKITFANENKLFDEKIMNTANDQAVFFFKKFRSYQSQLKLSEEDIGKAIGSADPNKFADFIRPKIEQWDKTTSQ